MAHLFLLSLSLAVASIAATLAAARPLSAAGSSIQLRGTGAASSPSASPYVEHSAMAPEMGKHRAFDHRSAAGGEVILGGLAAAIFFAVFCYIRITRKRVQEEKS